MAIFEIAIAVFFVISVLFVRQIKKRRKHPPGPLGLPLFGSKPYRMMQLFFPKQFPVITETQYFKEMKNKYGNFWSIDNGDKKIVILASFDIITEASIDNGKLFSGRPINEFFKIIGENRGIVFIDGDEWNVNRKFAIKALRELGMGKHKLESQISGEIDETIENIEKNISASISSPSLFVKSISNVINQLVFNMKNKYDDPELEYFIDNINSWFHSNEASDFVELFSKIIPVKYTRHIFPVINQFIDSTKYCMKFIDNKCRLRIKVESEYSKPNCVFDYFWRYRYQDNPEVEHDEKILSISHSMFDLFFAGIDTMTNLLSFSCLLLAEYRNIQDELRKEIQSLVDDYKLVNMEMRKDCPKILSFIDEVQRFCVLSPKILNRAVSNCVLRNFEIQSTDVIVIDLSTLFKDPTIFENPDIFDAHRFLDKSRTKYIANKYLIPFGIGRRACLGESIAVMELFLFLSKIILRFDILLPSETKDKLNEILEGISGIVHKPLDHQIIFQLRQID